MGEKATLLLPAGHVETGDIRLTFKAQVYLPLPASTQQVTVMVNDSRVGLVRYDAGTSVQETSVRIPAAIASRNGNVMNVDFLIDAPISPRQAWFLKSIATVEASDYDTRKLGVGLQWLKVEPFGSPE